MGGLNYDKWQRGKKDNDKMLFAAGKFPLCKGLFPDCPNEPSLELSACRCCPKTDELKKIKIEMD
jgi:hypothetical protein